MIGAILTTAIGLVAKGKAAKAIAGSVAGGIVTQITADNTLVDAFFKGVTTGALPSVTEFGVMVGQVIIGGAIGYAMTWFAPANAPARKG